jgi:nitroreductase
VQAAVLNPRSGPGSAEAKLIARRRDAVRDAGAGRASGSDAPVQAAANDAVAHRSLGDAAAGSPWADADLLDALAQGVISGVPDVPLKQLGRPGPDAGQLERLLQAAAAVPGRDRTRAWRLVLVPVHKRALLADGLAAARLEHDPQVRPLELALARQQAFRAPLLMLAVARVARDGAPAPTLPSEVLLGAALGSLQLAAHAMGYASRLSGGPCLGSPALRGLFRLGAQEQAACFVHVGTGRTNRPGRIRPRPEELLSEM